MKGHNNPPIPMFYMGERYGLSGQGDERLKLLQGETYCRSMSKPKSEKDVKSPEPLFIPRLRSSVRQVVTSVGGGCDSLVLLAHKLFDSGSVDLLPLLDNGTDPFLDDISDLSRLVSDTDALLLRSQDGLHFDEGRADFIGERLERGLDLGGERCGCVLEGYEK